MEEITLFTFYGHGDTINITCMPRIIKEQYKNIKTRIVTKESHALYFETNPYVDDIQTISNEEALRFRNSLEIGRYPNEVNMWCGAGKTFSEMSQGNHWDIPWESAKQLNAKMRREVVKYTDNILPELYYTDKERQEANEFVEHNYPFVIIETDCFSRQIGWSADNMMTVFGNSIKRQDISLFTASKNFPVKSPFRSLNDINLRVVGLIAEKALAFYGISSGLTVASFERTLKEPQRRLIAAPRGSCWVTAATRHIPNSRTIGILNVDYLQAVIKDIRALDVS